MRPSTQRRLRLRFPRRKGNKPVSDNDWETVTGGGDAAIKKWIKGQVNGKSCAVVLAGSATANRKWINHEIGKA